MELKDPAFKVTENADGSVSIQTDTFVPYCMLEGISADTIWNENVVAFTDKEAVTLVPVENQKISRDGVRIYDIYHTYHSLNDMSVKRSFDTHLIPGLLRSYAAPAILQIFEIRNKTSDT